MRMRRIVTCGPSGCSVFFSHYLINDTIFEKKKEKVIEHKMCVLIFCRNLVCKISYSQNNLARFDQKCILVFM